MTDAGWQMMDQWLIFCFRNPACSTGNVTPSMWHFTCNTCHVTLGTWHMAFDTWHWACSTSYVVVSGDRWHNFLVGNVSCQVTDAWTLLQDDTMCKMWMTHCWCLVIDSWCQMTLGVDNRWHILWFFSQHYVSITYGEYCSSAPGLGYGNSGSSSRNYGPYEDRFKVLCRPEIDNF